MQWGYDYYFLATMITLTFYYANQNNILHNVWCYESLLPEKKRYAV